MAEMVSEARTLLVEMACEKCEKGIMKQNGAGHFQTDKTLPTKWVFPHKCNNCGNEEEFPVSYPYQRLVPIEPLREPDESEIC